MTATSSSPVGRLRPPPIRPIDFAGTSRNVDEPLDPLVEQLTPMDEHERVDAALCDEPGGDHGLAERRRGGQHAGLVRQHRVGRGLLLRPQLAVKRHVQTAARRSARRE